jgi:hypothetical protein
LIFSKNHGKLDLGAKGEERELEVSLPSNKWWRNT